MNFTLKNRLRFLPETVIVSIIAVPLILTEKSTHFMYNHTCRMGNGSGSRRRLLNSVQAALKSPFSCLPYTAIPPPAALCANALEAYSSFSTVLQFMVNILPLYSLFVNLIFGIFQIFLLYFLRSLKNILITYSIII